ncbi:hypothetical protein BVRB_037660 [Beta vulgaris subsp. vulgaris]|uniref:Uncharacterized protein n=1 Tax=Beta vulgaris subsp. vulgaris TaxID=3555 RepID=A0A0J7YNY4_BETVV|nr:hypothetical protein BVRB_037660 [Beta vulgaris subsp. vulgaris]
MTDSESALSVIKPSREAAARQQHRKQIVSTNLSYVLAFHHLQATVPFDQLSLKNIARQKALLSVLTCITLHANIWTFTFSIASGQSISGTATVATTGPKTVS